MWEIRDFLLNKDILVITKMAALLDPGFSCTIDLVFTLYSMVVLCKTILKSYIRTFLKR